MKAAPKIYQCVMDATPFKWQQQQQGNYQSEAPKMKGFSMYIQHSSSSQNQSKPSSEPTSRAPSVYESTGVEAAATASSSPVTHISLAHGECGPVSSYVLPSLAGYPLIGEKLELGNSLSAGWSNGSSQICVRNGGLHFKVHPHDHDDEDLVSHGHQRDKKLTPAMKGGLSKVLELPSSGMPVPPSSSLFQGPALSSSSSSIGVGGEHSLSSDGSEDNNAGDGEVQSALRAAPLSTLAALEDSLPIKRGLSRYFTGQSKSFGCLADALSTSLAKPANPYARRRKGFALIGDERQRTFPPVSRKSASTGILKKNTFGNKSNLALAVAMEAAQQEEDDNDNEEDDAVSDDDEEDHPTPLPRMGLGRLITPSRSYSLSDLHGAVPPTRAFSLSDLQGEAGRG